MKFLIVVLIYLLQPAHANAAQATDSSPRLLVHLLDYLARDYGGAVHNGKVISESEYAEQMEFVETVEKTQAGFEYPGSSTLTPQIRALHELISAKADPSEVAKQALIIRDRVIELTGITTTPAHPPDLTRGAEIYLHRCTSCHGLYGYGDGVTAKGLKPKPISFHDMSIMSEITPLQIFHAVRLGVQGTAMVSQPDLSDQDTWDVAYYALTFSANSKISAESSLGDESLKSARTKLDQAKNAYRLGRLEVAKEFALAAYLEGFEPVEPKLRANDAAFVSEIETLMMAVRQAIDQHQEVYKVDFAVANALGKLNEVEARLKHSEMSPWMAFTAAAAILFREGFEAVLVILAFLSVVRSSGSKRAELWLHGGWIVAVALGVVAWFFSGWLIGISGAERETMEAFTAFFAAGVLLFVGFWLHQKTEIKRWQAFVQDRVKSALEQKSLWGLASISFIAVFRETLEVVLFLRAIWVDCSPAARNGMFAGMAISFAAVIGIAALALRMSKRIPIRQLFAASSVMMAALAVILLGSGLHSLQETGRISANSALIPLAQFILVALIFFLWAIGKRRDKVA